MPCTDRVLKPMNCNATRPSRSTMAISNWPTAALIGLQTATPPVSGPILPQGQPVTRRPVDSVAKHNLQSETPSQAPAHLPPGTRRYSIFSAPDAFRRDLLLTDSGQFAR